MYNLEFVFKEPIPLGKEWTFAGARKLQSAPHVFYSLSNTQDDLCVKGILLLTQLFSATTTSTAKKGPIPF